MSNNSDLHTLPENVFVVVAQNLLPIRHKKTTIGRHTENDIIIDDPRISRFHARIDFAEGEFILTDLGSTFGTSLNSERVEQAVIKSGDTISIANTPILFIDRSPVMMDKTQIETGMLGDE